ncbi:MAG: DUF881 domain-containing protein [Clostridia bacterium]|nr:DUF881 domain-containing protein [Clostridia bacterium]
MAAERAKKAKIDRRLYYAALLIIFVAIGAIVTSKIITTRRAANAKSSENKALIEQYQKEAEELGAEVESIRADLKSIESRYRTVLADLKETDREFYNLLNMYTKDLETLRFRAGLTTVAGSGIIIKLDDSGLVQRALVHDTYLTEILNVLKEAGAQAISINGERIVPTSEVLCLGPSIRVNGVRLFAPYRISAVGDADTLLKAYQESRIYATIVTQNLLYDVQKSDRIVIGSFTGNQEKLISNLH